MKLYTLTCKVKDFNVLTFFNDISKLNCTMDTNYVRFRCHSKPYVVCTVPECLASAVRSVSPGLCGMTGRTGVGVYWGTSL